MCSYLLVCDFRTKVNILGCFCVEDSIHVLSLFIGCDG